MHGRRYMDMRNCPWWCCSLHKFRWSENHMEYIWTTLPWHIAGRTRPRCWKPRRVLAYIALKDSALHLFRCGLWKQSRKPLSSGSKTMCVCVWASDNERVWNSLNRVHVQVTSSMPHEVACLADGESDRQTPRKFSNVSGQFDEIKSNSCIKVMSEANLLLLVYNNWDTV